MQLKFIVNIYLVQITTLCIGCLMSMSSFAAEPLLTNETKLTASDAKPGSEFSYTVAVNGDTVVIGAVTGTFSEGIMPASSRSAYIFERNHGGADNWGEVKILSPPDPESGDSQWFGRASIDGDTVVVGATFSGSDGYSGSAYFFERNEGGADNWGSVKKIKASDAVADDLFGAAFSINSGIIAVGAPKWSDGFVKTGAVYIHDRNQGGADNWGEVKKLLPADINDGDGFGAPLSLKGDILVVGVPGKDDGGSDSGAVYIFYRNQGGANNWGEVKKLVDVNAEPNDRFGSSVSVSGDTVMVGTFGDTDGGLNSGTAYVFERNKGGMDNWGLVKKITVSPANVNELFGVAVSISDDIAVVGSMTGQWSGDGKLINISSPVYVFERNWGGSDNWGEVGSFIANGGNGVDWFGVPVAISGKTIVVGARYDNSGGELAGAAYVFQYDGAIEGASDGGDGGCFIATAAYGSVMAADVLLLQKFRDEHLLTNSMGREFVELYYRYSPPLANYIAKHETLRTLTRWSLSPIISGIKHPSATLFMTTGTVLLIMLFTVFRWRKQLTKRDCL